MESFLPRLSEQTLKRMLDQNLQRRDSMHPNRMS